ncbi:MAG: PEP-CTERM sorting domain-containing protein [Kiritimatiellae bacterium]|nr:PEP-CTERM sorting domain-containing protein [Kiritimatiellia bacterium]
MKKILSFFALAALVGAASAASLKWDLKGSAFGTSDGSATRAYGYYVAVVSESDLSAAIAAVGDESAFSAFVKDGGSATTSRTGAASGTIVVAEDSGTSLSYVLFAFDASTVGDASNYIVSAAQTGIAYEPPATPTAATFNAQSFSGSTWTAVPEPATAALALLGLGLMIKRRKA